MRIRHLQIASLSISIIVCACAHGDEPALPPHGCGAMRNIQHGELQSEFWSKVIATKCLTCHRKGGEAEASRLVFVDPDRSDATLRGQAMEHNHAALARISQESENDQPRLLQKVAGELEHGGDAVLTPESTEYRLLADFVLRARNHHSPIDGASTADAPPFFDGVSMLDDRRLLRRATLSLAGRLPKEAELAAVAHNGREALSAILDDVMGEEAYYDRLREGFNDIFLTLGVDGNADQTCLSYEHFEKTRHWYQNYDLSHISDKDERQRTEWRMADQYRQALLAEPMKLIEHIVRNDRPFTEIVTADYIMVSPYSARGYGVFDDLKDQFKNPNDPFEYAPVRLKALVSRDANGHQESATGFYPHAGLLSTFQYLTRYPTTETNRNRLRARMFYQHFLGVDVLELAARVSDAAAVTAKFQVPTMEAADCVVCHKSLDPVAGLFQDYWRFADEGVYGKRKEGWFTDMFAAGFNGEELPADERWRSLQWLGERTAKDPRFAVAMTQHVYYILMGRKTLLPPKEIDDPLYEARWRANDEQRREVEKIAQRFADSGFNLKSPFKDWVVSDYYRADALESHIDDPRRLAELDDLGLVRLLSPEQLERKVQAIFGEKWGRLNEHWATLYGGIDSKEITERAADPSGAMGAIQRTLSNEVACRHVARDFALPPGQRRLFPGIEPSVVPGVSIEGDEAIRQSIVYLHEHVLGRYDDSASEEIERTFALFSSIVQDAQETPGLDARENYFCRPNPDNSGPEADDPNYTIRAWRAVITYLLRRPEFLYE